MKYKLKSYNIWELGQREKQEDSIYPAYQKTTDNDRLFILCDGMGGHSAGEVASSTVCEALSSSILSRCPDAEGAFTDDDFKAALADAFDALDTKDNGAAKKMGTTLTFLKLHDKGCTIAHIGDSRVYHIRPGVTSEATEILFQTRDHSLVNDLVKIGELTPEEAKHSKQKNIITRAMQPCMERRTRADMYHTYDIRPGDYFMLCSDGILEQMEDEDIKCVFSQTAGDVADKVGILIDVTKENRDNHSAFLVYIEDVIDAIPVADTTPSEVVDSAAAPVPTSATPAPQTKKTAMLPQSNPKVVRTKLIFAIVAVIIMAIAAYSTYKFIIATSPQSEQVKPVKGAKPQKPDAPAKPVSVAPQKPDAPAEPSAAPLPTEQVTPPTIPVGLRPDSDIPSSDAQIATDLTEAKIKCKE